MVLLLVLKRIAMTTTISPLTIACGIIPSTFLYSRDMDVVHVVIESYAD